MRKVCINANDSKTKPCQFMKDLFVYLRINPFIILVIYFKVG